MVGGLKKVFKIEVCRLPEIESELASMPYGRPYGRNPLEPVV